MQSQEENESVRLGRIDGHVPPHPEGSRSSQDDGHQLRTVEYTDEAGRTVYRTYRKPEPSYLKLHDETGQPWQISVTTDGELRTTRLNIEDEYGEITFGSLKADHFTKKFQT